jgi:hypothetical protein
MIDSAPESYPLNRTDSFDFQTLQIFVYHVVAETPKPSTGMPMGTRVMDTADVLRRFARLVALHEGLASRANSLFDAGDLVFHHIHRNPLFSQAESS